MHIAHIKQSKKICGPQNIRFANVEHILKGIDHHRYAMYKVYLKHIFVIYLCRHSTFSPKWTCGHFEVILRVPIFVRAFALLAIAEET